MQKKDQAGLRRRWMLWFGSCDRHQTWFIKKNKQACNTHPFVRGWKCWKRKRRKRRQGKWAVSEFSNTWQRKTEKQSGQYPPLGAGPQQVGSQDDGNVTGGHLVQRLVLRQERQELDQVPDSETEAETERNTWRIKQFGSVKKDWGGCRIYIASKFAWLSSRHRKTERQKEDLFVIPDERVKMKPEIVVVFWWQLPQQHSELLQFLRQIFYPTQK